MGDNLGGYARGECVYTTSLKHYLCQMVEKTGWEANKKASPIYKRDIEDGSMITDENCNPILDCDFSDVIKRISHSQATCFFSWLPYKFHKSNREK